MRELKKYWDFVILLVLISIVVLSYSFISHAEDKDVYTITIDANGGVMSINRI